MSASGIRYRSWRTAGGLMAAGVMAAWVVLGPAGVASAATPPGDWYGYAVTGATTYTSTTAAWTMPVVSCTTSGTYIAIWTGLDGYSSPTVEQIGAEAYCSGSTPAYFGWYDLYPGAPVDFSKTLKPGDSLQASVTFKSSKFTLTPAIRLIAPVRESLGRHAESHLTPDVEHHGPGQPHQHQFLSEPGGSIRSEAGRVGKECR